MIKVYNSPAYKYMFNLETGFFARWGATPEDDPEFSPVGPEIADIEVSTICSKGCPWCYKSNKCQGRNMSLHDFKIILNKFPNTLTQVAFGIGDIDANPDLWKMMEFCREKNVIPNLTINGDRMTPELYDKIVGLCGAVAVSLYDKDTCYNAIEQLTNRGMNQVNIHSLLAHETYDKCIDVLLDSTTDKRLEKLNAVIYLWLKPKGERNHLTQVGAKDYRNLVRFALEKKLKLGFDSCSAPMFLKAVEGHGQYKQFETMCEPCESTLFSYYINTDGVGFPCSFSEGVIEGIDVLHAQDFMKDVWNGKQTTDFRTNCIGSKDVNKCRNCTIYKLGVQ